MLLSAHRQRTVQERPAATQNKYGRKGVRFTPLAARRHIYEFDWEYERAYWYSRTELNSMKTLRVDDATVLRKVRNIKVASRNDADELSTNSHDVFVGYKITNALDDSDDNHEISIRGIEHFVFPVLQKEMVGRKKQLKKAVLAYSRNPQLRKLDPMGIKLANESATCSQWARDVASERGIKYCEMKRGLGRGGGLLQRNKLVKGNRRLSTCKKLGEELRRMSLRGAIMEDAVLKNNDYES